MEQQLSQKQPISKNINLPPIINNKSSKELSVINEETKTYIEEMKKGSYNILVAVRCRPLSQRETELSNTETVKIMDNKIVVLLDPIEYNGPNNVFKNRSREQTYAFDFAFDKYSTQLQLFENTTKFLIDGVVNGFNATVFAYGATGAGKTYTMLGNDENPGIMPNTLAELFKKVEMYSNEREYKIKLWYLEIYNENIRDLLTNNNDEYLDLREDPNKGIVVSGITELNVTSCKDILKILKKGNKNRTQEATGANETSSRSHAILQVLIEYKDKNSGIEVEIKMGKLSLIDLAGSERASATQNRGIRLIEGANINRSLLTLGNCINALCDANLKGTKPYIPYRDSKLTRLLKDSLGGNARTVMIANVAPSINTFDDTYNTLKYANRAKNIKTYVQRNVLNAQYHISNYVNIINNLKAEVNELKMKLGSVCEGKVSLPYNIESKVNENKMNTHFEKVINEMKHHCEKQLQNKQTIIHHQIEYNKLIENSNNSNMNSNDISNYINNENITDLSIVNITNNHNLNKTEIIDSSSPYTTQKEKLLQLSSTISQLQLQLNEYKTQTERILNNSISSLQNESEYRSYHGDYLKMIYNTNQMHMKYIEKEYELSLSQGQHDIKDEYIQLLEQQIKMRDDYFLEKNINIYANNPKLLNVNEMRNDYKRKVPKIQQYNALPSCASVSTLRRPKLPPVTYRIRGSNNINNGNSLMSYKYYTNNNTNKSKSPLSNNANRNGISNTANTNNNIKLSKKSIVRNNSQIYGIGKYNSNYMSEIATPNKQNNITHQYNKNNHHLRNHSNGNYNNIPGNLNIKNYQTRASSTGRKNASARQTRKTFNKKRNNLSSNNNTNGNNPNIINTNVNNNNISVVNAVYADSSILEVDNSNDGYDFKKAMNKKNHILGTEINNNNINNNLANISINNGQRLLTTEQMPQMKKSELNTLLSEKNRKRQQLLDKLNPNNKQ
jgi:kinesin family protein 18/19